MTDTKPQPVVLITSFSARMIDMMQLWASFASLGSAAANDNEHDVIIIGAGMSGVSAAAKLLEHNISDILVLEAASTIGGRVQSTQFGDPAIKQFNVELGANWIHGIGEANPVWRLAQRINLSTQLVPGSTGNLSNYGVFQNGKSVDVTAVIKLLDKTWECANRTSS